MAPLNIRVATNFATKSVNLLRALQSHPPNCPCHLSTGPSHGSTGLSSQTKRSLATPLDASRKREYAFEMAASSIRFGPGCTKEVGMDFRNIRAKRVCVVTDGNVSKLDAMSQVVEGLSRENIEFTVFSKTQVEPKDSS